MADTTTDTSVTVMSAEQVTQLITAITTSLSELKTAVVTELASIKTNIAEVKTQLQTGSNAIVSKIEETNTNLNNLKTSLTTNTASITDAIDISAATVLGGIAEVNDHLEVDITPSNLNLEYGSVTGKKSIAFVEASRHVLTLKRIKEADEEGEDSGDSGSDSTPDSSESEAAAEVNEEIRQNASEVFENLVAYEFGVTEDERITF